MTTKLSYLSVIAILATACSGTQSKYQDTSYLEKPPTLEIFATEPELEEQPEEGQNLTVYLDDAESPPVLKVKKLFDRAWELVIVELDKQKIRIIDKNRDQGEILVKYVPAEEEGYVLSGVKVLLFADEYVEAEYKISINWHDTLTEIRSQLISKPGFSVDEEDEKTINDASEQLINTLYKGVEAQLAQ